MEPSNDKESPPENSSEPYNNAFNLHFHNMSHMHNIPSEKRIVLEPNQIPFPDIVDPRHQSLTEDIEEFKHFRNVIAAFLNYKVILIIKSENIVKITKIQKIFKNFKNPKKIKKNKKKIIFSMIR